MKHQEDWLKTEQMRQETRAEHGESESEFFYYKLVQQGEVERLQKRLTNRKFYQTTQAVKYDIGIDEAAFYGPKLDFHLNSLIG